MFDHIGIYCSDLGASKKFYDVALAPLGIKAMMGTEGIYWGFGVEKPSFWIAGISDGKIVTKGIHVAFSSPDRKTVDAFYAAAIAAGATDNGKPGLRSEYHEHYYGAFVLDRDGNNVEVVCHKPE